MTDRATIPDYSYWNGKVDFNKAKAKDAPAVILRSSWGMYADTKFQEYRNQCEAINLPWLAYHYYDFRWTLDQNIAAFKNSLAGRFGVREIMDLEQDPSNYASIKPMQTVKAGEVPEEVLDIMPYTRERFRIATLEDYRETLQVTQTLVPTQVQGIAWSFLNQVKQFSNMPPWLYTGYFYFSTWLTNDPKWLEFKLWLAWYALEQYVKTPPPYGNGTPGGGGWTTWQYTGNGNGPEWGSTGLSQDLSLYYGTAEQFKIDMKINNTVTAHDVSVHGPHYCVVCGAQLVDIDEIPAPPEPPIPPLYPSYKVKPAYMHPYVRNGDATTYTKIGYLIDDDQILLVDSIDQSTGYCHIQPANGYDMLGAKKYFDQGGWVWTDALIKL